MATDNHARDQTTPGVNFFGALPVVPGFLSLTDGQNYHPLPDDWIVLITDIATSRAEIQRGNYKAVNMVGASIIAAIKNITEDEAFPFVFGGDGATLALPGSYEASAESVAASLVHWAQEEFGMTLRAGIAKVSTIRAAGLDVRVAKYAASSAVSYAAFAGGGVRWLEARVKSGEVAVDSSTARGAPNLDGLSCRWSNVTSSNGSIVSLVLEPSANTIEPDFVEVAETVLRKVYATEANATPMPEDGPGVQFPPPGMTIEARASRAGGSTALRYLQLAVQNLFAWFLFRTGVKVGSFDPTHYARQTGQNTDHRKFEDGLKITLDCDDDMVAWLKSFLARSKSEGKVRFGLQVQSEALLTCIVPSPFEDNHIHFVDGANGGYAAAASML